MQSELIIDTPNGDEKEGCRYASNQYAVYSIHFVPPSNSKIKITQKNYDLAMTNLNIF